MRRSRKILLIVVLAVLVIGGTLGGVAIANADEQNTTTTTTIATSNQTDSRLSALFDKVAEIYQNNTGVAIDSQELAKAFKQAGEATLSDRLSSYLDKLVQQGKITQEQADQFKQWWNSKPDIGLNPDINGGMHFGRMGRIGGMFRDRCLPRVDNSGTANQ
jgi:hypothetical protein